MQKVVELMKSKSTFSGSNTEFLEMYNQFTGREIKANSLKRMMNHWKYDLEENGVIFESRQSNGKKYLDIRYEPRVSMVSIVSMKKTPQKISSLSYLSTLNKRLSPGLPTCRLFSRRSGSCPSKSVSAFFSRGYQKQD